MTEREKRLDDIESSVAELRDEADDIWLSEVNDQLQGMIHTLEIMSNQMQGIENQTKALKRLLLAIGLAVAVSLAGSFL